MPWYSGGLRGYWKRRAYRTTDGEGFPGGRRSVKNKIVLGGKRQRRGWRIRAPLRLRFLRAISPKKILSRIRDGYVRMMLAFANYSAAAGCGIDAYPGFYPPPAKEYDERMILEVYRSLMAHGQIIATANVGGVPSGRIVPRR